MLDLGRINILTLLSLQFMNMVYLFIYLEFLLFLPSGFCSVWLTDLGHPLSDSSLIFYLL